MLWSNSNLPLLKATQLWEFPKGVSPQKVGSNRRKLFAKHYRKNKRPSRGGSLVPGSAILLKWPSRGGRLVPGNAILLNLLCMLFQWPSRGGSAGSRHRHCVQAGCGLEIPSKGLCLARLAHQARHTHLTHLVSGASLGAFWQRLLLGLFQTGELGLNSSRGYPMCRRPFL